jgi:hypothetical protein
VTSYIQFVEIDLRDGRKTKVWAVLTIDGTKNLGHVSWYGAWRKYTFCPGQLTVFDKDCLREIADFCEIRTDAHRSRNKAVDHINSDPSDNRIENLRITTIKENRR